MHKWTHNMFLYIHFYCTFNFSLTTELKFSLTICNDHLYGSNETTFLLLKCGKGKGHGFESHIVNV